MSFMADIVIVYIYVSPMNSYLYAYIHPQIPPVLQTSMYHPWMSKTTWDPLVKVFVDDNVHPQIIPGYHHYVLWTSMYHPWMSTLPGTPLSKYPWMIM